MGSVYSRDGKLYISYVDRRGVRRRRTTGLDVGREAAASKVLAKVEQIERTKANGAGPKRKGGLTVERYIDRWLDGRKHVSSWQDDWRRLRHVVEVIGRVPLKDVREKHAAEVMEALRAKDLAPRTQLHVYRLLRQVFKHAVRAECVERNPIDLDPHELPKKRDKDPAWRAQAVFTVAEIKQIIADERIPLFRRVLYSILFLTGVRFGEASALRWNDLVERDPLNMLHVYKSYDTKKKTVQGTKTDVGREVPVHPVLALVLEDWRSGGWEKTYGRAPTREDLVIPNAKTPGRGRRVWGPHVHVRGDSLRKQLRADLKLLKLRPRTPHDSRATFISVLREEGAGEILEWVTHAPGHDVRSGYTRPSWKALCRELTKFPLSINDLPPPADESSGGNTNCDTIPSQSVSQSSNPAQSQGEQWSRRESNPRPKMHSQETLRV